MMSMPQGVPNCPKGLEYLTTLDQILVKQQVELLEGINKKISGEFLIIFL